MNKCIYQQVGEIIAPQHLYEEYNIFVWHISCNGRTMQGSNLKSECIFCGKPIKEVE